MTGLKQRLFRRRASGSPDPGASGTKSRPLAGLFPRRRAGNKAAWGKRAEAAALPNPDGSAAVHVVEGAGGSSFRDRGKLRRRLQYLRRARELAFRDVGGLIFDMRRFGRERPDLVEAKLTALAAVDQELRAIERVLDDRRPIHELREPGLSSCPRCGALHASEDHFCPRCGMQIGGPQAMGEVGGAIAAPPQAPPAPVEQPTATTLFTPLPPPVAPQQPPPGYVQPPPAPPAPGAAQPPQPAPPAPTPGLGHRPIPQPSPGLGHQPAPHPPPAPPAPPAPDAAQPAPPAPPAPDAAQPNPPAPPAPDAAKPNPPPPSPTQRAAPPPARGDGIAPAYPEDAQPTEIYRPPDVS